MFGKSVVKKMALMEVNRIRMCMHKHKLYQLPRGVAGDAKNCPIARCFRDLGEDVVVHVAGGNIHVFKRDLSIPVSSVTTIGGMGGLVPLVTIEQPLAIKLFVGMFDKGRILELQISDRELEMEDRYFGKELINLSSAINSHEEYAKLVRALIKAIDESKDAGRLQATEPMKPLEIYQPQN